MVDFQTQHRTLSHSYTIWGDLGENSRSELMTWCVFIPLVCSFLAPIGGYHVGTGGFTVPDHTDAGTPVSISWFPSPRPHLES